jgi:hypothetical protein
VKVIKILRLEDDSNQSLSFGWVFDRVTKLFEFRVLELPWKKNRKRISCIPKGLYDVEKFNSPTFGNVFLFNDVQSRDMIEMHPGNYNKDTLGCLLPGEGFTDINRDGLLDVVSSRNTMEHLWDLMPDEFKIEIL